MDTSETTKVAEDVLEAKGIAETARDNALNIATDLLEGTSFYKHTQDIGLASKNSDGTINSILNLRDDGTAYLGGSRIVLDGDTIVDGTFTVTDSMIASNAQIDGAKIADATIGSAKISSLDADKISGNIGDFVRLNLNDAMGGNVSVTGSGIKTTAPDNTSSTLHSGGITVRDSSGSRVGIIGASDTYISSDDVAMSFLADAGKAINFLKYSYETGRYEPAFRVHGGGYDVLTSEFRFQARNGIRVHNDKIDLYNASNDEPEGTIQNTSVSGNVNGGLRIIGRRSAILLGIGGGFGIPYETKMSITESTVDMTVPINMGGNNIISVGNVLMGGSDIRDVGVLRLGGSDRIHRQPGAGMRIISGGHVAVRPSETTTAIFYEDEFRSERQINMRNNPIINSPSVSDIRVKDNIKPLESDDLETIKNIEYVTFDWADKHRQGQSSQGMIAQQVLRIAPQLITTMADGKLGYKQDEYVHTIGHSVQQLAYNHDQVAQIAESNTEKIHKLNQELSKANKRIAELEGEN